MFKHLYYTLGLTLCLLFTQNLLAQAQLLINELQASNVRTIEDERENSSDWVEVINTGDTVVFLGGHGLSDNPLVLQKFVLPEIVLDPGEMFLIWCSGENRVVPPGEIINSPRVSSFKPTLVNLESEWSYLTGAPEDMGPPAQWNQPGFDDSAWSVGLPGFGFGDNDDVTELPQDIGTVFLRHTFHVENPALLNNLIFRVFNDDGFVLYLNGVRVLSDNVILEDGQEPTFSTLAESAREAETAFYFDLTLRKNLLHTGDNLLAVALMNSRTNSNDLSLIPELGSVRPIVHTNFMLDSLGETLFLSNPAEEVIDSVAFPSQTSDRSYGRYPDGSGEFSYMVFPTPEEPNDKIVSSVRIPDMDSILQFEPRSGLYTEPIMVEIKADFPLENFEVRYTRDGIPPTESSLLYEEPVEISRDSIFRAAVIVDSRVATMVLSSSYFGMSPASSELVLPVMSISMDPSDYIFVHETADGRGRDFEFEAYMEIFDANGVHQVGTGCGFRLHGGAGRLGDLRIKKAYKTYFRSEYGDTKLRFPLFPDSEGEEVDKLVLRSNYNDAFRTGGGAYIRDQVIRDLHQDMGHLISHGTWYNLFVNMRYRGLYNVVEGIEKDFLSAYFPEEGEDWDIMRHGSPVGFIGEGDDVEWRHLLDFLQANDMSEDANYETALEMIDIQNFTDYMILNIWAQNHDWPHNNWYAARPRIPDGKWTFFCWDSEFGMGLHPGGFSTNTLQWSLSQNASMSDIFDALLDSREYQRLFLTRLSRHLEETLSPENVLGHIDRQVNIIEPDMVEEIALNGVTEGRWLGHVFATRSFANGRNPVVSDFVLNSSRFEVLRDVQFKRGDANGDGRLNVTDPVTVLRHIFIEKLALPCEDALDANDSGSLNLSDAILILDYLFFPLLLDPLPALSSCDLDRTPDNLTCNLDSDCPN